MKRTRFGLVLVGVAFSGGCEPLRVPEAADAGSSASAPGDAAAVPVGEGSPLVPAGALAGEPGTVERVRIDNWGIVDDSGTIVEVSFAMPILAVDSVPSSVAPLYYGSKTHPEVAKQTGIQGISYSYMPMGHIPAGVYDVPHWEWHVTYMSLEEFEAIDCTDLTAPPDADIPPGWVVETARASCLEGMGFHCFSLMAPEYNGQRFTHSFSTGYYGGKFIAYEPKVTVEYLRSRQPFSFAPPDMRFAGKKTVLYPLEFDAQFVAAEDTYVLTFRNFQPGTRD
jgi:hypothetical protein